MASYSSIWRDFTHPKRVLLAKAFGLVVYFEDSFLFKVLSTFANLTQKLLLMISKCHFDRNPNQLVLSQGHFRGDLKILALKIGILPKIVVFVRFLGFHKTEN